MNGTGHRLEEPNFQPPQTSVLGRFSAEAGESVAFLLIRELIDNVDRPQSASAIKIQFETDSQLEWIMQVINHAFFLPMQTPRDYETVRAAVRIYLAWLTGINIEPHAACPSPLSSNPIKYFSQILNALRALFIPRSLTMSDSLSHVLTARQASEMRSILLALRNLYGRKSALKNECHEEVWQQTLRFLMAVNDNLLGKLAWPEELSAVMAGDLSEIMFDAWLQASLVGQMNKDVYWKELSNLAQNWITHVPFIECWSRRVSALTVIFAQKIYGSGHSNIPIHDEQLLNAAKFALQHNGQQTLNETWHELVNLLGNPAHFLEKAESLCEHYGADSNLQSYIMEQTSLSFFLAISAYSKMVDIFFGDSNVSIDFHEIEDLHGQWVDANKTLVEEPPKISQQQSHRASNLSTTSSNHSNQYSNGTASEQNTNTFTHNSLAQASNLAVGISQHKRSIYVQPKSSVSRLSSRSIHAVSLQTDHLPSNDGHQNGNGAQAGSQSIRPANRLRPIKYQNTNRPPTDALLEMFLPWLWNSAMIPLADQRKYYSEDVISQKSFNSAEIDTQQQMIDASGVNRRSFATSTASSSDISSPLTTSANAPQSFGTVPLSQSQLTEPSNIPSVDGIAAGRATALGALCRIVCSKPSTERLNDDQLAQFLCVLHDALIQRDRLVLCSLIFHSTELFKLGLRGVEMLFPNFAMAIDLVLTESFKLRLNPSIHEIDMRHACLRAMASIISWPTTFGTQQVISPNVSPRLHQGTQNLLEPGACYLEVRSRFIKNLVHTLRNETDSMNLQLALALSCQMCFECTLYDLQPQPVPSTPPAANKERKNSTLSASDDNSPFVVSALKRVVSAICDNLCKPQWASELATILAVFDFLNAIASQPKKVLFHNMELSIGSLIISSLCRFVNAQLQKPPPLHSKDLHSSVVAAFHCLEVWLCAAPMLCEMESCIATVAETIEFGMSGGKALAPEDFKPASQRVFDAAENLQQTLFSSSAMDSFVDEESVLKKLGDENLSLDRFQHFLVDKSTLLSLHDITELDFISKGLPTLVMISRTPYRSAHASLIQLRSASHENKENLKNDSSPKTPTSTSAASLQSSGLQTNSQPPVVQSARKRFDFPREIMKPQCKLDEEMHKQVGESKEVAQVEAKLHEIRERLASGSGCAIGNRDASNVWIQSSLGELLCQPPTPEECVRRCNSIRIFLYDMGLINRAIYGNDLIALDISANVSDYYTHLHQLVDRQPAKRCESVSLFYVRQGQHQPSEILQNGDNLATLDPDFCQLVASLGRVRDTRRSSFWTGHWSTAFDAKLKAGGEENGEKASGYKLDGLENCLWWSDSQMEISYTLPTERSANHHLQFMSESGKEDALSNSVLKTQQQTPRNFYYKQRSMERSDSVESTDFIAPLPSKGQLMLQRDINHNLMNQTRRLSIEIPKNNLKRAPLGRQFTVAHETRQHEASNESINQNVKDETAQNNAQSYSTIGANTAYSLRMFARKFASNPAAAQKTQSQGIDRFWSGSSQQSAFVRLWYGSSQVNKEATIPEQNAEQPPCTGELNYSHQLGSPNQNRRQLPNAQTTSNITSSPKQQRTLSQPLDTQKPSPAETLSPEPAKSEQPSPTDPMTFQSTAVGISYIKSFFRRRPMLQSQLSNDSTTTTHSLPSIPEPASPSIHNLSDVTEKDWEVMFPRMPRSSSSVKGYTPSSTSSSLAPASRTGSSLTGETGTANKPDISQHPTSPAVRTRSTSTLNSESSGSQAQKQAQPIGPQNIDRQSQLNQAVNAPNVRRSADQRILVVWLERIEDMTQFPYEQLLPATDDGSQRFATKIQRSDLHILFVHNFERGLVRVNVESVWTKTGQTGPLVDGVVVSTSALPTLLRQTVANIARRKAVEVDQPTNSYRRRQSILELSKKFANPIGYTEFLDRFINV